MIGRGKATMDLSAPDSALLKFIMALSSVDRIGIVNSLMGRIVNWMERDVGLLEDFSPNVRKRVELLMEIQGQHDEHKKKFLGERAALEASDMKLWKLKMSKMKPGKKPPQRIIPLKIQKREEGALDYLKDIKCCKIDEPKGFKLGFYFDTNPYFMNPVLTKTYLMINVDDPF